jgi:hypothetical protein
VGGDVWWLSRSLRLRSLTTNSHNETRQMVFVVKTWR